MNNIYLVDYPNVGEKGLKGIRVLDDSDKVCIYHNALFSKATYDMIQDVKLSRAKIELIDTGLFLNMLEVQLANAFGQLGASGKDGCVCVISKRQSLRSMNISDDVRVRDVVFASSIEKCEIPERQPVTVPEALPSSDVISSDLDIDADA